MEGKDSKVRRNSGSGSAIYEKYLNIKSNVLVKEDEVAMKTAEISNSTDKQELEAGEVYAAVRLGASNRMSNDERDLTLSRIEERGGMRSPRMRQSAEPVSPPRIMEGSGDSLRRRSRSRSRSRRSNGNGMLHDMNEGGQPWPPLQGPTRNGRFDGFHPGGNGNLGARGRSSGRPNSPGGRRGSPLCGGFDTRSGSLPRDGFYGRPGSPPHSDYGGRSGSPRRIEFKGGRSPPRGNFGGVRESPRRDGFNGPPVALRGHSPSREDFWRGQSMSYGRDDPPRDFCYNLGQERDRPRGRTMGGHDPGRARRSRSRTAFPRCSPRGPPRNSDGNGFGPLDLRPGSGSPRKMGMGGLRSPSRNSLDDRGFGGPPLFEDRGPSSMGRPLRVSRSSDFGPRSGNRSPPRNGCGPSSEQDGLSNMFRARGRSRSPNRPPSSEMMRKRDRSRERDSPRMMEPRPFDTPSEWNFELRRSGKVKCRCSATSFSVGISRQLPLYLDVVTLPHLRRSPEFLQLERPNIRRVVYELKPESMADASGYREFVNYLIQGRGGHARAGAATEMEPQGFKIFLLPPGQAARQIGYKGDHMVAVLRSR